jgi:predicted membrane protein
MDEPRERWSGSTPVGDLGEPRHRRVIGVRVVGPFSQLMFGLLIVGLGVVFTLDNMGLVHASAILRWWPAALLLYGTARLTGLGCRINVVAGVLFSLVGGFLLLHNLHVLRYGFWDIWPLVLVVAGVSMVARSLSRGRGPAGPQDVSDTISAFAIWSGTQRKVVSQAFRGGDVTAVMGGHEIDLRGAQTVPGGAVIDLVVWWGGVVLRVPEDWAVSCEAVPLMAGIDDHSRPPAGGGKGQLILRGVVVMGGVEVKN